MHVQYVALCDQVILANDGRPSLIGVFNDLAASALPITVPRLAFAARILFTAEETGKPRQIEVIVRDPNGMEIGRPSGELALPKAPAGVDSLAVDIPIQFDLFEVSLFGRYTFLLHIDGAAAAAVQLSVRQAPATA
jgi:hypothetical protein